MNQVTVRICELKAAMQFASVDESRAAMNGVHIEANTSKPSLLISTNGRALAVIETEYGPSSDAFDHTFSLKAINLALKLAGPKDELITASFSDDKRVKFCLPISDVSVECPDELSEAKFPNWRKVVPEIDPKKSEPIHTMDLEYFSAFIKAAKILSPRKRPVFQMYSADELSPVVIRFIGIPDFYGALMPLPRDGALDLKPEFVR